MAPTYRTVYCLYNFVIVYNYKDRSSEFKIHKTLILQKQSTLNLNYTHSTSKVSFKTEIHIIVIGNSISNLVRYHLVVLNGNKLKAHFQTSVSRTIM
uniref:Uncharacterized protein n=1 Tax=Pararge aegeria TaxID=116150 RepID=S4PIM4_9NEOP